MAEVAEESGIGTAEASASGPALILHGSKFGTKPACWASGEPAVKLVGVVGQADPQAKALIWGRNEW